MADKNQLLSFLTTKQANSATQQWSLKWQTSKYAQRAAWSLRMSQTGNLLGQTHQGMVTLLLTVRAPSLTFLRKKKRKALLTYTNNTKSPLGESATNTQTVLNILRQLFCSKYNQKYLLTKTHTALNCNVGQIYEIWKTLRYSFLSENKECRPINNAWRHFSSLIYTKHVLLFETIKNCWVQEARNNRNLT